MGISVSCPYNNRHWQRFFALIGRPELAADDALRSKRPVQNTLMRCMPLWRRVCRRDPTAEWLTLLEQADIPCGPMHTPDDLFNDPHLQAVGMFPEIDHPTEGRIRHIKVPVQFSKTPGGLQRHAERLGGSSAEVLRELGYSQEQISALAQSGVTLT